MGCANTYKGLYPCMIYAWGFTHFGGHYTPSKNYLRGVGGSNNLWVQVYTAGGTLHCKRKLFEPSSASKSSEKFLRCLRCFCFGCFVDHLWPKHFLAPTIFRFLLARRSPPPPTF